MASFLRPRRGKKATAVAQLTASAPLKRGEIFFEVPDTGCGTGTGKIKMGDGTTAYASLPYFMEQPTVDYTNAVVGWTNTTAVDSDPYSTNATYAGNIIPSASLKTIFTNLKKLLMNYNSQLTSLNNDLASFKNTKSSIVSSTLGGKLGLTSSSTWDNVVTAITSATVSTILSFSVASTSSTSITFTWKNPASGGFAGVVIVGKTGSYPSSPTDGTVYYTGTGNNTAASGTSSTSIDKFSGSTTYYFRSWSYVLINNVKWYSDSYKEATCTTPVEKGQKIFTTSGTWTVPSGVTSIDIFCVGGGGAGHVAQTAAITSGVSAGGGGGGGYTATKLKQDVTPGTEYTITIGAGGTNYSPSSSNKQTGNTTSFDMILSAEGGYTSTNTAGGGDGGSGGGRAFVRSNPYQAYDGGSDGGNGGSNLTSNCAKGQGTTTRAFGESSNTLYAGGGGGGGCDFYVSGSESMTRRYGGNGGTGGGGNGGTTSTEDSNDNTNSILTYAKAGTANTGGGGGGGIYGGYYSNTQDMNKGANGGSGICIIRWGY